MILHIGDDPCSSTRFFCQGDRIYPCFRTEGRIWYWRPARSQYRIESVAMSFALDHWHVTGCTGIDLTQPPMDIVRDALLRASGVLTQLEFMP